MPTSMLTDCSPIKQNNYYNTKAALENEINSDVFNVLGTIGTMDLYFRELEGYPNVTNNSFHGMMAAIMRQIVKSTCHWVRRIECNVWVYMCVWMCVCVWRLVCVQRYVSHLYCQSSSSSLTERHSPFLPSTVTVMQSCPWCLPTCDCCLTCNQYRAFLAVCVILP